MTRPGDSSLIAIAITSIRGQRRTRTIVDRTTSMILFRNRPNQMSDSARRPLSPSFELHSTNGRRSTVEQAGVTLLSLHAIEEPLMTKCRGLKSLHDVWNMDGFMSQPEACPLRSKILESMTDHHCELPLSERPNVTPFRLKRVSSDVPTRDTRLTI